MSNLFHIRISFVCEGSALIFLICFLALLYQTTLLIAAIIIVLINASKICIISHTVVNIYTPKQPELKQQVHLESHHFAFVSKQVPNKLLSYL